MKFQQLEIFEKHLKEAFPKHLSKIYFVVCFDVFERRAINEMILKFIKKEEGSEIKKCSTWQEAQEHLNQSSLFQTHNIVIFDILEPLSAEESENLVKYLLDATSPNHLIVSTHLEKHLHELYLKGKKEVVMLDLSGEKPWQRKQRLKNTLLLTLKELDKKMSSQTLEFFLDNLPLDLKLMEQELIKLSNYVGIKKEIVTEDILLICSLNKPLRNWQIAETLIWGDGDISVKEDYETSDFFLLMGQLRYHLELGLKISSLMQQGENKETLSSFFPDLKTAQLEKYALAAKQKETKFFKRGLLFLYEFEFAMKNSEGSPILLFDLFRTKLQSSIEELYEPFHERKLNIISQLIR